jgi:LPS-assembly protein
MSRQRTRAASRGITAGNLPAAAGPRRLAVFVLAVLTLMGLLPAASLLFADELPKKIPVQVTADKLDYDRTNDIYTAVGHVKVEQQDILMEADRIVLNNRSGEAIAEGNVYIRDKGDTLMADRVELNLNTRAGVITKGRIFIGKDNLHLSGDTIERRSEHAYHVENGVFTTCDDSDWFLHARQMDVDMDRYATGSGVSFNMAGMPVLYTPYLLFPVRRQSGLLIPVVGFSSTEGFLMKNAVFWAISDHQDMTFYSDYRAKKGVGTGVEYRYVNSRDSEGKAYYNYFDSEHGAPNHWELKFQHREEFAEDLSFRADVNLVDNWTYYRDLEKTLEIKALPYIDSNVFYVERWNTASLYLLGQYSTDLSGPNDKTVQKAPELRYTIYDETIGRHLNFRFEGRATNFTSGGNQSFLRSDLNPELGAVLSGYGLSLTPRIGGRATFYDRGATSYSPTERKYVYAGADLNARFSRVYGTDAEKGIGRIRHSIEPTISYSFIPSIEAADIPQLDAIDQVRAENMVTAALINRLTARYAEGGSFRTFDLMVFRLAESYDVKEARTTAVPNAQPRSELKGELYLKTPKLLSFSATENYNTYTKRVTSSSESLSIKSEILQADVTHQYLRDPRTRFLITGLGTTIDRWSIHGQVWRDVENRNTTQQEYSAHYASQCWGLGLRYVLTPGERQYLVTLDLKGLGTMKF